MTECNTIFEEFKDKITDYGLLDLESDIQEEILLALMNYGCRKFNRICKSDLLDRSAGGNFKTDLSYEETDIITEWMVEGWVRQYKNNSDLFSTAISTSDFKQNSPANLLEKVNAVYKDCRKQAKSLMNQYSFVHSDFEKLKP